MRLADASFVIVHWIGTIVSDQLVVELYIANGQIKLLEV